MIRLSLFSACVAAFLSLPGFAAGEEGVTLLIDRRAAEVSVYLSLPADRLPALMGHGADEMLGPDGTVDIEALYDGTFDTADALFAGSALWVDGEAVAVEALSMMLHDPAFLPPFRDPYDGQMSIAVCTSPETVRGMGLSGLRAYLGYYAWQVDGLAPLELTFPRTGRGPVEVTLRVFDDFVPRDPQVLILEDGGTVAVSAGPTARALPSVWSATFGALALLAGFLGYTAWRTQRRALNRL